MMALRNFSWEAVAAITAIAIALASIAFSFGLTKSRIDTLERDVDRLRELERVVRSLDKNLVKIHTRLEYIEPGIAEIKDKVAKIDEKVNSLVSNSR